MSDSPNQLGSIFQDDAPNGAKRGRDLKADVTVPAQALGDPDGFAVEVPLELAAEGGMAQRTPSPYDEGAAMVLRLPETFPDGGTLRLRGQGESVVDGRAGDLLLTVRVDATNAIQPFRDAAVARPPGGGSSQLLIVLLLIAAGALFVLFLP